MTIGDVVKSLRTERGWTQKQLADEAGVPAPYVCRLEKGHGDGWDVLRVFRIAKALGLTLDQLIHRVVGSDENDEAARLRPAMAA